MWTLCLILLAYGQLRYALRQSNLDELAAKAKKELDNDPDLIIETDIEEGRLIICRAGVDEDD